MHASIALPLTTDIEPPCALYRKFLQRGYVKHRSCQAVVKTTFNASTQGRGRGRIRGKIRGRGRGRQIFVNSRPTWSIGQVPGQPEVLHKETLCQKKKGRKKKRISRNLAGKLTQYTLRGPRLGSQHKHSSLKLSVTPIPPSNGLFRHPKAPEHT